MSAAEFFVLGSGSFAPGPPRRRADAGRVRNPAGYALRRGAQVLLFDFGFGSLRQLARAGIDPDQVSHVFVTHRHPDHVGDLAALLFYYRYEGKPKGARLRLYGPRGFRSFLSRLISAHHPWLRPRGFQLSAEELEESAVVTGQGWRVHCREVPHTTEALAYRFESPEGSVCYSGDTAYDRGLAGFASGAGLFVIEATVPDGGRAGGHLRVSQAIELARLSGARRVLFSHLSPDSDAQVSRRIAGSRRFRKAEDLMKINLRDDGW